MHITTVEVDVFKNLSTFTSRANEAVNDAIEKLRGQGVSIIDIDIQTYQRPGRQIFVYTIKHSPIYE